MKFNTRVLFDLIEAYQSVMKYEILIYGKSKKIKKIFVVSFSSSVDSFSNVYSDNKHSVLLSFVVGYEIVYLFIYLFILGRLFLVWLFSFFYSIHMSKLKLFQKYLVIYYIDFQKLQDQNYIKNVEKKRPMVFERKLNGKYFRETIRAKKNVF